MDEYWYGVSPWTGNVLHGHDGRGIGFKSAAAGRQYYGDEVPLITEGLIYATTREQRLAMVRQEQNAVRYVITSVRIAE